MLRHIGIFIGTMMALVAMWFLISIPLCLVGGWLALRKGPLPFPASVNQIPRQIPPIPRYLHLAPSTLMAGILPFGAAFIEICERSSFGLGIGLATKGVFCLVCLDFGMSSLFGSRSYYAVGFAALTASRYFVDFQRLKLGLTLCCLLQSWVTALTVSRLHSI
jgi:transmembrane 9 superfamily protein 2/4